MTRDEYLGCDDPNRILAWAKYGIAIDGGKARVFDEVTERKFRLFVCAVARMMGMATKEGSHLDKTESWAESGARPSGAMSDGRAFSGDYSLDDFDQALSIICATPIWASAHGGECSQKTKADLLRDIIGDPFRPVRIRYNLAEGDSPPGKVDFWHHWITPDVSALACNAYSLRNANGTIGNDRLAVLSDALIDAGCPYFLETDCPFCSMHKNDPDNPFIDRLGYRPERDPASGRHEGGWGNCKTCSGGGNQNKPGFICIVNPIIDHLRSHLPHIRGCWVLDIILENE